MCTTDRSEVARTGQSNDYVCTYLMCCVFHPGGTLIDSAVDEYRDAVDLVLPTIPRSDPWTFDGLVDAYGDLYGEQELAKLLMLVSPEGGGMGWRIKKKDQWIDGWGVDDDTKTIYINDDEVFSSRTNLEAAHTLKDCIERTFEGSRNFWDHAWRVVKGTGIAVFGAFDVFVGFVGIIVPEPGTTAGGVALTVFGSSMFVEGVTQVFDFNNGEGINPLAEGAGYLGRAIAGADGETVGRVAFSVANLVVSLGGSYKILKVPGRNLLARGTVTGKDFKTVYNAGYTVGRLQMLYPNGSGGFVILNITNNSNQWILRFQNITGRIVLNGRIVEKARLAHRVESTKEMLQILIKLARHGW